MTHQSDVLVDRLNPPVCAGNEEFGVYELLNGENDAVADTQSDGSAIV